MSNNPIFRQNFIFFHRFFQKFCIKIGVPSSKNAFSHKISTQKYVVWPFPLYKNKIFHAVLYEIDVSSLLCYSIVFSGIFAANSAMILLWSPSDSWLFSQLFCVYYCVNIWPVSRAVSWNWRGQGWRSKTGWSISVDVEFIGGFRGSLPGALPGVSRDLSQPQCTLRYMLR